jgi:hypothetical protein
MEIYDQRRGGGTGKTKLCATCKVPLERLGRPDLYRGVAAWLDQVDGSLHHHVTNAQCTHGLGRQASRSEFPQEPSLPVGKPLLEKQRPKGHKAPTGFTGERLGERFASIHCRFNGRRREMVAETHCDLMDARHGQESGADIFGHHIGKVRGTPTRW